MTDDAWTKQAARIRVLSRDRATGAYLLGRLCAHLDASELADLVEAALVYRERFGAGGNRLGPDHEAWMSGAMSRAVSTDTPERGGRKP